MEKIVKIKILAILGLGLDFLFHWLQTGVPIAIVIDGTQNPDPYIATLALAAHSMFILAFLSMLFLPLRVKVRTKVRTRI
ncbi:hypothetical protein E6H23_10805 [Candidatus Bathyarchaeota archaeon]|nr:MAG: hypothetical protein E6H23_10805 [Candidatus Bathyarchaeota archaeon]